MLFSICIHSMDSALATVHVVHWMIGMMTVSGMAWLFLGSGYLFCRSSLTLVRDVSR